MRGLVRIGPYEIIVDLYSTDLPPSDYGQWSSDLAKIDVNFNQTHIHRVDTFFHELMEAINDVYDVGLSHQSIQTIGTSLAQAVVSNPLLIVSLLQLLDPLQSALPARAPVPMEDEETQPQIPVPSLDSP